MPIADDIEVMRDAVPLDATVGVTRSLSPELNLVALRNCPSMLRDLLALASQLASRPDSDEWMRLFRDMLNWDERVVSTAGVMHDRLLLGTAVQRVQAERNIAQPSQPACEQYNPYAQKQGAAQRLDPLDALAMRQAAHVQQQFAAQQAAMMQFGVRLRNGEGSAS